MRAPTLPLLAVLLPLAAVAQSPSGTPAATSGSAKIPAYVTKAIDNPAVGVVFTAQNYHD